MKRPKLTNGWTRKKEIQLISGIVVLALGVRLIAAILLRSWEFSSDDHFWAYGYEMGRIAASLATGHGFAWPPLGIDSSAEPTAWMAPAYPAVIALAFKLFGIYTESAAFSLVLFQSLLSAATCAVLFLLGKRLFNAQVALLSASILALYPASIHFAVQKIWSTTLFGLLLPVLVLLLCQVMKKPNPTRGAFLGLAMGVTALVNPIVLAVVPLIFLWLLVDHGGKRLAMAKSFAVMVAISGLVIAPWIVRNHVTFGQFVFIKSNFGHELYLGNNTYATGRAEDTHRGRENVERIFSPADLEIIENANEATRNRVYTRQALDFIQKNPLDFLELSVIRTARYWTVPTKLRGSRNVAGFIFYLGLVLFAAVGFLITEKRRKLLPLMLFVFAIPLPYYFTVVAHYRYRFPIEPLLMILAAKGIYWIWIHFSRHRSILARRAGSLTP